MTIHTITQSEKEKLTGAACELFKMRNPDYWPTVLNSDKLVAFVESQIGMTIDAYPYPILVDAWQASYDHIKATSFFYERPVEEEIEDPAVTRERLAQQKVRDDHAARQQAEQLRIAKTMPLNDLRKAVGVGDAAQRARRSVAERTQDDRESNRLTPQELDARARARHAVMVANPSLNRNSLEFSKLVAEEMAKN